MRTKKNLNLAVRHLQSKDHLLKRCWGSRWQSEQKYINGIQTEFGCNLNLYLVEYESTTTKASNNNAHCQTLCIKMVIYHVV